MAKAHDSFLCQKISLFFIILGIYNFALYSSCWKCTVQIQLSFSICLPTYELNFLIKMGTGQWFTDFDLVLVEIRFLKPNRFLFLKWKFWVCFDFEEKVKIDWLSQKVYLSLQSIFFVLSQVIRLYVKAWSFFIVGWILGDVKLLLPTYTD